MTIDHPPDLVPLPIDQAVGALVLIRYHAETAHALVECLARRGIVLARRREQSGD